jgi:molecular chaperone GrpE (heat shock protein)
MHLLAIEKTSKDVLADMGHSREQERIEQLETEIRNLKQDYQFILRELEQVKNRLE